MSNIKNPNACVMIWTYKYRLTHERTTKEKVHEIQETVLNTLSLISIQTNKTKSAPNGSFTFTLAPYKNWVGFIAPGSWCAILMTNNDLPEINKSTYKAKQSELKFFGRIDSVRAAVHVDENGARNTIYICEGQDWGSVFNSVLYVDASARQPADNAVGTAAHLVYASTVKDIVGGDALPTTTDNVEALVRLWGTQSSYLTNALTAYQAAGGGDNLVVHTDAVFKIPKEAAKFLNASSDSIAQLVLENDAFKTGILTKNDTYKETKESVGIIDPNSVFGTHPLWSVMKDNSNEIINEMFCDLRWVDGKPKLALYKRVKPFITRNAAVPLSASETETFRKISFNTEAGVCTQESSNPLNNLSSVGSLTNNSSIVSSISSYFQNIRKVEIPLEEIISFDAGTNWRDKLNFIEILPDESQFKYNGHTSPLATVAKAFNQKADMAAFGREGFKGAQYTTKFFPLASDGGPNFYDLSGWSSVLAQWYFNSHNYLNGTIEFIGQNEFIGVGDNILIDSKVFGPKPNLSKKHLNRKQTTYLLLHVEVLSHNFQADQNGARHWTTTIQFSRGVLVDSKGKPLDLAAIDTDSSKMSPEQERNNHNSVSTSSIPADPDVQKVRGT